jgi:exodeoxyribonuclease VII small subunit
MVDSSVPPDGISPDGISPDGISPDGVPPDGVPPDGAPPDIAAMSFEDALAELEQIVRRLEGGQVKLDEAIISYERGAQLKRHCERKLNEAQQRVDRIVIGPEGAVGVEPAKFD